MLAMQTTADLDAPMQTVWAVLADLPRWPTWNPSVAGVEGTLALGAPLRLTLSVGSRQVTTTVRVVRLEPGRALAWKGGVPGLTQAEHGFELQAHGDGTRLVHTERFSGVLPWLLWPWLQRRLMPRYVATNDGLAAHVAGMRAGRADP